MSACRLVRPCRRSEVRSCGNVEQFSELPEDILVDEILHRLPVKSLIRFTVVCKFWYDLIQSPNFKKKRVPLYYDSRNIRGCNLMSDIILRFFDANVPVLKLTVTLRVDNVQLVGCCNGIVCLSLTYERDTFALWNPATTQSRLINLLIPRDAYWIYSGFFFDSLIADSCKLVRFTFLKPQKPEESVSGILSVFTLKDNKWKNKELLVPCRIPRGGLDMSPVTCLNTCMYWILTPDPYCDSYKYILCLDVVDEVFKHISIEPSAHHVYGATNLLDYKGSLAMFVWENVLPCHCFDMWVLNDDCGGNWHKQLTFRPSKPEVMNEPLGFISKEGHDLVLVSTYPSCQFLLCDTNSGKTTELIRRNCWTSMHPFFLYSETFASV